MAAVARKCSKCRPETAGHLGRYRPSCILEPLKDCEEAGNSHTMDPIGGSTITNTTDTQKDSAIQNDVFSTPQAGGVATTSSTQLTTTGPGGAPVMRLVTAGQ